MKLSVDKSTLLGALDRCVPVASGKSPMPILSCVLLRADGKSLVVAASSLNNEITCTVAATVSKKGLFAVDAKAFANRISSMPDGTVELTVDGYSLVIGGKGKKRRFTLPVLNGEDFPKLCEPAGEVFEVPSALLAELIAGTKFSISPDETRQQLNALLVEFDGNTIAATSTDGHRLSRVVLQREGKPRTLQLLIPLPAVTALAKLLDESETVGIAVEGPRAAFTLGGCSLSVKLAQDCHFPPYNRVIPKSHSVSFTVNREELIGAVKAVSSASEKGGMLFSLEQGELYMSTESPDKGEGRDAIEAHDAGDSKMRLGLSYKYLIDVLLALTCENVRFEADGELDPLRIAEPERAAGTDSVYIIMPMRI